jgi:aminoglycoside phosphotransferase (APT) family kinase protein
VRLQLLKRGNDVYRAGDCFIKLHTKSWYADDPRAWAGAVQHEAAAYACLAEHGLPAPHVVIADSSSDNAFGRPYLMTRALAGAPLTSLLEDASPAHWRRLLEQTGDYLRRMHAITFEHPGYIMGATPTAGDYRHPCWTDAFGEPCQPPGFVHGDCHAHQIFLTNDGVSGIVDMEVASAGDPMFDLMKFSLEMAMLYAPATRWWEPFFAGYGGAPVFEHLQARMLTASYDNYQCLAPRGWACSHAQIVARLRAATDWPSLLNAG